MCGNLFSQFLGDIFGVVRAEAEKETVHTWVASQKVQRESQETSSGVPNQKPSEPLSLRRYNC